MCLMDTMTRFQDILARAKLLMLFACTANEITKNSTKLVSNTEQIIASSNKAICLALRILSGCKPTEMWLFPVFTAVLPRTVQVHDRPSQPTNQPKPTKTYQNPTNPTKTKFNKAKINKPNQIKSNKIHTINVNQTANKQNNPDQTLNQSIHLHPPSGRCHVRDGLEIDDQKV